MCQHKRTLLLSLILLLNTIVCIAQPSTIGFRRLPMDPSVASSQINCIMRDSHGYIWLGTQYGLVRYDGFRFSVLLHQDGVSNSLPNDIVDQIQEDRKGHLWVHTANGYCVYDNFYESFINDTHDYLSNYGISGTLDLLYIDEEKNLWVAITGKGLYKVDANTDKTTFLAYGKQIHNSPITCIVRDGDHVFVNFSDGLLVSLDANSLRQRWQADYIKKNRGAASDKYTTYVDDRGDLWVIAGKTTYVYGIDKATWYSTPRDHFNALGYKLPFEGDLLLKGITSDRNHHLWIATDHNGLLMFDHETRSVRQFLYNRNDISSVPDNSIQCLYVDSLGALWIGTYKNGIAYYSPSEQKFETIYLGDICTITQDAAGLLWCGSNDSGIITYNPITGDKQTIDKSQSGLGSNTVVSSLTASDGSLWFGTYNGGLAHYSGGSWKIYRANDGSGLANDNVWSLCQLPDGRIVLGTLGSGVQIFDVNSGKFTTYNMKHGGLTSDYISSVTIGNDGRIIASHSEGLSVIDSRNGKVENIHGNRQGILFPSQQFNQVYQDSRGIIWCATLSGTVAFDPKSGQMSSVKTVGGVAGSVVCSVAEDKNHDIWVVNEHSISKINVRKDNKGQWDYFVSSYNSLDGLQERLFNYRSIRLLANGDIVAGGQDGINMITPQKLSHKENNARVMFSGVILFDHPMHVGEEYNGRVILKSNIDESREIKLKYGENAFTILLASSEITVPQKSRFLYRLKGFSDKWILTPEDQSTVTFTNLLPGSYTLEARVINRDGSEGKNISSLSIIIAPPFYLSIWAILLYIAIISLAIWYWRRLLLRRQKSKLEVEQYQREAERTREMEEMKLTFFTNVSHELRTPLMLIISPLQALLRKETDPKKHKTLELIYRNAQRLLGMVGQILDFRKVEKGKETLNLLSGDIVGYVRNLVSNFQSLGGKNIAIFFHSQVDSFNMAFDSDKVRKIIDNLMSNALKYTPDGGKVDVSISIHYADSAAQTNMLEIAVADNGVGISDDDKKHIFERFYMTHNVSSPYGGTGVGLSLARDFAILHGGDLTVADNKGGGTVFTVSLPIKHKVNSADNMSSSGKKTKDDTKKNQVEEVFLTKPIVDVDTESAEKQESNAAFTDGKKGSITSKAKPTASGNHRPSILVVDDSTDFLSFITDELGQHYEVRTAENGREALDKISERKPDLILSDVMMPVMDGNELCKAVKSNKHTADIPFVMLTARLAQEHQIEGLAIGADDYITKPFNLDMLYMRINNLLKWHNAIPDKQSGKLQPELKHVEITSLDKQLVDKATQYVDDNIRDSGLNVESMAKAMGMSRVQLYKRLLPITGSTPTEFIRQIRLRRAEQLLRESQLSVSEVAYSVGFNNPRYFSKYFKEMYGVMPSQYKK